MNEKAGSLVFAFILGALVTFLAWRAGFCKMNTEKGTPLKVRYLLGAFATYIGTSVIILPLFYFLLVKTYFRERHFSLAHLQGALTKEELGWLQVFSFLIIFLFLSLYLLWIKREVVLEILFGNEKKNSIRYFGAGALTLLFAYPVVLFFNLLISALTEGIFGKIVVEQVAVNELKAVTKYPSLFLVFGLIVSTVVPFLEEVLFRGFLQTTLRRYFGSLAAIISTSLLFALAHFSKSQGLGNLELLSSLFILSLYLGFLYEKYRNLSAPIGLHATFNAVTILGILAQS